MNSTAVHTAYISSLESQLSTCREELAAAYKVQSQNAQRLITLTDLIREKEERGKEEEGEKRVLRAELERLARKAEEARELKKDQERNIQVFILLFIIIYSLFSVILMFSVTSISKTTSLR